jgi:hypothetical protein
MLTIECLIAPSMHRRIVEDGQDSALITTFFAGWALVLAFTRASIDLSIGTQI